MTVANLITDLQQSLSDLSSRLDALEGPLDIADKTLRIADRPVDVDPLAGWLGTAPWEPWPAEQAAERFAETLRRLT